MVSRSEVKTIVETYFFGDFNLDIERVKNLDEMVDQVSDEAFNEDERLPYWAELWPSAIALSRHIISKMDRFKEKEILELGCGIGLTSLCLALCDPSELVLTDYEPGALTATKNNFIRNGLKIPEMHLLDWRHPDLERTFELIIASDILYEKRFFDPLLRLFDQMLQSGGYVVIAEPGRPIAQNFFEMARKRSYFFSMEKEEVVQEGQKITVNICYINKIPF